MGTSGHRGNPESASQPKGVGDAAGHAAEAGADVRKGADVLGSTLGPGLFI